MTKKDIKKFVVAAAKVYFNYLYWQDEFHVNHYYDDEEINNSTLEWEAVEGIVKVMNCQVTLNAFTEYAKKWVARQEDNEYLLTPMCYIHRNDIDLNKIYDDWTK